MCFVFISVCVCVSPAVCLSLCVLPRLWPIMHIFALFIFPLIPQYAHPHVHSHTCMRMHKYTHYAHTMPEVVVTLGKQAFIFVFVLAQTKMVQQFHWSLFPAEKKKKGFGWSFLCCDVCESVLSLGSVVQHSSHFACLNDFSLSKNLELLSKTHPKMVLSWVFLSYNTITFQPQAYGLK